MGGSYLWLVESSLLAPVSEDKVSVHPWPQIMMSPKWNQPLGFPVLTLSFIYWLSDSFIARKLKIKTRKLELRLEAT